MDPVDPDSDPEHCFQGIFLNYYNKKVRSSGTVKAVWLTGTFVRYLKDACHNIKGSFQACACTQDKTRVYSRPWILLVCEIKGYLETVLDVGEETLLCPA